MNLTNTDSYRKFIFCHFAEPNAALLTNMFIIKNWQLKPVGTESTFVAYNQIFWYVFFFTFTSLQGGRRISANQVLRHSIPIKTLPCIFVYYACWVAELNDALCCARYHSQKIKILNISVPRVGIAPTTYHCATTGLKK